jgi:hypothetical protein
MVSVDPTMTGSYNRGLVLLSVAIAILASFAALDLAERVTAASGCARWLWLADGAGAMGFGIWSMHYIAAADETKYPGSRGRMADGSPCRRSVARCRRSPLSSTPLR